MVFSGAKIALFCAGKILVYRRDDKPGIPFPGLWDLPGGGREGDEPPEICVLREVEEEFGLRLPACRINWSKIYPARTKEGAAHYFMVGSLTDAEISSIRFGDEGQDWALMSISDYLQLPDAIKELQLHVTDYFRVMSEP